MAKINDFKKLRILLLFTYKVSLKIWYDSGLLFREIALYKKLVEKNNDVIFLTFGDDSDLNYSNSVNGIKIFPVLNFIKSKNRKKTTWIEKTVSHV